MDRYAGLIEAEQVRAQYHNLPVVLFGSLVTAGITAVPFIGTVSDARIGIWLALVAATVGARWVFMLRAFNRAGGVMTEARPWLVRAWLGALAGGCAWGAAGFLLYVPDSVPLQAWLALTLAGMGVASIAAYAAHLWVHSTYLLTSLAPLVATLLSGGTLLALGMALGVMVFAVAMFYLAKNFSATLAESLRLRFENLNLVAELRTQKEAAEAANLAKSRFLAAASHDLRQPMHAMSLYMAALGRKPLRADEQSLLGNLRRCADAMDGLFSSLLDISRLDASVVKPEISAFALNQLMDRIRVEFEPLAREKGIRLELRPTALVVRSDPGLLERVLRNLASNAVRYTERGRVVVACRRLGEAARIMVGDTGPGIPEDKQRLVFEEFFQIGNPERDRSKGLGLGLAVVDRLVKLLGLRLTLKSRVGSGTVFMLEVPRAAAPDADARAFVEPVTGDVAGALALVVEDELEVLEATRVLLESWEVEVVTAASGAEALARLATVARRPDVLISDYRLRGAENGIHVIEMLRGEFNHDIPALLITGDTAPDRLREAQASGLVLLHKPVDGKNLHQALTRVLAERPQFPEESVAVQP